MIRREPYWHMVVDNALPTDLLEAVDVSWPAPDWPGWCAYDDESHHKHASDLGTPLPPACGEVLHQLALLDWASLTGRADLVYDLSLHGAGLHEMSTGDVIGRHLDADHHPRLGLSRALSVVLYVHREWELLWGGNLELHDATGQVSHIEPLPGRLVALHSSGIHAVGPVLAGTRRSLSLWLYGAPGPRLRPRAQFLR